MTKSSAHVVYDSATDTLYVTTDRDVPSLVRDGDPGKRSRYRIDGEELVGMKTADFSTYWGERFDALPREVVPRSRSYTVRSAAAR